MLDIEGWILQLLLVSFPVFPDLIENNNCVLREVSRFNPSIQGFTISRSVHHICHVGQAWCVDS